MYKQVPPSNTRSWYDKILKLITMMCVVISYHSYSQTLAISSDQAFGDQIKTVLSQEKKLSLKVLLSQLESKFKVHFIYESNVIEDNQFVENDLSSSENVDAILSKVLNSFKLKCLKLDDRTYGIIKSEDDHKKPKSPKESHSSNSTLDVNYRNNFELDRRALSAPGSGFREGRITGRVVDNTGAPLPGVSVVVKETTTGTVTDANGVYSINVPAGQSTLVFSFIGFAAEEVAIGNRTDINITLNQDMESLGEVVVVGYGTQKRKELTGSITSISNKDYQNQPVTRVDQILQGRAPGVQIVNSGGAPGGDVRIRIRGANSLAGGNEPLYVVDGFVGADFNTINPEDIASIDVLKDASATAIYGSRGANGVVILTTKSGNKGQAQVDFGARYYSSEVINRMTTLNAADFAQVVNERAIANSKNPLFTEEQIAEFRRTGGTDWQDEIFRVAPGQEYQLGVSGGTEKTKYMISGNYLNQNGVIVNSDFKRYSIRTNITSQLSDKLSIRFNLNGNRRENHNTGGITTRNGVVAQAVAQALSWGPTTPARDKNGEYTLRDPVSSLLANPLNYAYNNNMNQLRTNAYLLGGIRYEFLPGFSADVQLGLSYLNQQDKNFFSKAATLNVNNASRGSIEDITWQNTNTLNYRKALNDHSLELTGVIETQKFTGSAFTANATNVTYQSTGYDNISISEASAVESQFSSWTLFSVLGRVNYSFKNRYLLTATIRRDGSSRFQKQNRFSTFPSVSAGWRLSEEAFLRDISALTNLKIRGSWGITGNQAVDAYGTLSRYVTNTDNGSAVFVGGQKGQPGILMGNPGNPNLKWETTQQIDLGADLELFNGLVAFSADYFLKNTKDLLIQKQLPEYIGGYNILSNVGEIENRGWEFALSTTVPLTKNLSWSSSLNLTLMNNKVTSLDGVRDTIPLEPYGLIAGQSMNAFYGYKYLGTWKADEADAATAYNAKPGDARYEDVNNDNFYNAKDLQVIGNGTPTKMIGWNNTFAYKGLSLNIFFQGLLGYDKLNYTYAYGMVGGVDTKEIIFEDIKNRYIPGVNETSNIPAFSSYSWNTQLRSSRFIEKGDFIRLKNISLSYSLPKSVLKNIAAVRVFVSATNLLTFTNYKGIDPESNSAAVSGLTWDNYGTDVQQGLDYGSYPNSKTYTAGINLTF